VCFVLLVLAWFIARLVSEENWESLSAFSRVCGYTAALAMLIPYLHILRRFIRYRYLGQSYRWLNWHIGAAYAGFFFLLVHCRARAESGLTMALVVLVWSVMLSGVIGFYGQKLLYRLLPRLIPYEYGMERLEPERQDCLDQAYRILAESQFCDWKQIPSDPASAQLAAAILKAIGSEKQMKEATVTAGKREPDRPDQRRAWVRSRALLGRALYHVLDQDGLLSEAGATKATPITATERRWANLTRVRTCHPNLLRDVPQAITEFCDEAIAKCLARPFTLWRCTWARKDPMRLDINRYERALEMASQDIMDRRLAEGIWKLVQKRRLLDLEYRLHVLGRLWLLFHGPLAVALLILMIEHISMSMRFGGF
jgi:hypothetical protein